MAPRLAVAGSPMGGAALGLMPAASTEGSSLAAIRSYWLNKLPSQSCNTPRAMMSKGKDGLAALTRERKQKHLSKAELRELWNGRVSLDERVAIENSLRQLASASPKVSEMKAMDFAIAHCYERASIVTDKELLRQALRYGIGDVSVEHTKRQLLRDEFIEEELNGHHWFTTKEVLTEEKRLIDFVQSGRGKFKPFSAAAYQSCTAGIG